MTKSHLSLDDRITISQMLSNRKSFKQIASALQKSPSSISREVRNHLKYSKTTSYGRSFNNCLHRKSCSKHSLCPDCSYSKKYHCAFCNKCSFVCPDFSEEICYKLSKPPYVCNSCKEKSKCTLEKRLYDPAYAHKEYKDLLSESRTGLSFSEQELQQLDKLISPLILKGQSLNHICANNKDSIMVSESTLYRLINDNYLKVRNIDLPRKVKYAKLLQNKKVLLKKTMNLSDMC